MSANCGNELLTDITRHRHPSLCIHIGMGRAGSSAIQSFLYLNRKILEKNGWSYPDSNDFIGERDLARKDMRGNMVQLSKKLCTSSIEIFRRELVCLERALDSITLPHILLSSEWLWNLDESLWSEFYSLAERLGRRLLIIAYVREQREWLLSVYAQRLKSKHWTMSAEQFLHNLDLLKQCKTLDYFLKYKKILECVNKDALLFRLFEREQLLAGDVCRDFLEILKIHDNEFTFESSNVNSSPGIVELELMRVLNEIGLGTSLNKRKLLRLAADMKINSDRRLYRLVLPETLNRISQYYDESNQYLLKVLFAESDRVRLFNTSIPDKYDLCTSEERVNESSIKLLVTYFLNNRGVAG